ncbi:hypothetical protein DXD57_04940 [Bacteroides intestinalis]|nr:hypothetical protein DXD57_04940 [Bacteroides intestinalis]
MLNYKRFTFNYRHSVFYCISKYYLRCTAYMGYGGQVLPHSHRGHFRRAGTRFRNHHRRVYERVRK